MIQISVTKTTCEHGASIFSSNPNVICLGGMDASGVDKIHVDIPDDWKDCVVRITFISKKNSSIAKILDEEGNAVITSDITSRASNGILVIDAVKEGYAAYTDDVTWTTYAHSVAGGAVSPDVIPKTEYEQMVAIANELRAGIPEDELLDVLVETDILPAVADVSGAILTDEQDKILIM